MSQNDTNLYNLYHFEHAEGDMLVSFEILKTISNK